MTRINTNVSSLIAQNTLNRSNSDLQTALTRLSTGLRINKGSDDPAGLIASEGLRSDIVSLQTAISNSERANQMIATADSSLGQVSKLLNDIRGLVTEAANTGALSDDQIAANQLQVDSSLEALNRIAQTTSFGGRRLLDGSLDFISTVGTVDTVEAVEIHQANLGATGSVSVDVDISTAATQATSTIDSDGFSAVDTATATLNFAASATVDSLAVSTADFDVIATSLDSSLSGVEIHIEDGGNIGPGNEVAVYNAFTNRLTITIDDDATMASHIAAAINSQVEEFEAVVEDDQLVTSADAGGGAVATTGIDSIEITADVDGADSNDVEIRIVTDSGTPAGTPTAAYDAQTKILTVTVNDTDETLLADIVAAINPTEFTADATAAAGTLSIRGTAVDVEATANTDVTGGVTLEDELVMEISGAGGSEVFQFEQGASVNQIAAAINLVSDATGVTAAQGNDSLTLNSAAYGSRAFVAIDVIKPPSGNFEDALSSHRVNGTDIDASVNGVGAEADGNTFSINTATLDLRITVTDGSDQNFEFDITGGGARFQLGPDVVSNQQAQIGIQSVNSARLGGASGRMYELGTGGTAALDTDTTLAASIVDQAIYQVTTLRGRLGAFQRTTLDTNIAALGDTLSNVTEAESEIRDADFAVETAALTRAQILVQSGTSVLAIANSNPQNVLALLR